MATQFFRIELNAESIDETDIGVSLRSIETEFTRLITFYSAPPDSLDSQPVSRGNGFFAYWLAPILVPLIIYKLYWRKHKKIK